MNLQRLKFAWARGARMQFLYHDDPFPYDVKRPYFGEKGGVYLIHPDDEHLQYGHLSQALRDSILRGEVDAQDTFDAATGMANAYMPQYFIALSIEDGVLLRMFRLFFAELLADEGL